MFCFVSVPVVRVTPHIRQIYSFGYPQSTQTQEYLSVVSMHCNNMREERERAVRLLAKQSLCLVHFIYLILNSPMVAPGKSST